MQRLRVHGVGLTDPLGKLHLLGKGLLVRLSALVHIAQSQIPLAQYASGQRGVIGVPLLFTGQAGHDLVTAFGLHAVGRNLHSVCVAYALVGKLLLAALISLHKRLQVIIVSVAGHVALAGYFGPVKLPLCRAYRVGVVSQCGDSLLHTLVCGGHEFWNVSGFGVGGEQTIAVSQRLVVVVEYGKVGKFLQCLFVKPTVFLRHSQPVRNVLCRHAVAQLHHINIFFAIRPAVRRILFVEWNAGNRFKAPAIVCVNQIFAVAVQFASAIFYGGNQKRSRRLLRLASRVLEHRFNVSVRCHQRTGHIVSAHKGAGSGLAQFLNSFPAHHQAMGILLPGLFQCSRKKLRVTGRVSQLNRGSPAPFNGCLRFRGYRQKST